MEKDRCNYFLPVALRPFARAPVPVRSSCDATNDGRTIKVSRQTTDRCNDNGMIFIKDHRQQNSRSTKTKLSKRDIMNDQ